MPVSLRKERQRRQQRERRIRVATGALMLFVGLILVAPYGTQWIKEQYAISQMKPQAAQSVSLPEPLFTRTPTPEPTPASTPTPTTPALDWQTWKFDGATLSAPTGGIADAPIHEILPEEFLEKTIFDANGNAYNQKMVSPYDKHVFTWFTVNQNGVRTFPVGGIISGESQGPIVLYCHNYRDGTAVCSFISTLALGDTIVITTASEVLTYRLEQVYPVLKADVEANGLLQNSVQGDLFIITCDSQAGYTSSNEAMGNSLIHFKFVSSTPR